MSFTTQVLRGVRVTVILRLLTVVVITLPMLGLARLVAPDAADGSLLRRGDQVVGARLIGQTFRSPRYLQGRPAGAPNLAASNPELAARVADAASGCIGGHQPCQAEHRQGDHHHGEQPENHGDAHAPQQLGCERHQNFSG